MKICFPSMKSLAIALAWLVCIGPMASITVAQENVEGENAKGEKSKGDIQIRIVGQDGKPIKAVVTSKGLVTSKGVVPPGIPLPAAIEVSIRNEDGKLIIVDGDGNERVIDVQDAKSIFINQQVQTTSEDGNTETMKFGKAIIIDANGKRQEIVLGNPIEGSAHLLKWQGMFQADRLDNNFMIGVYCQPVSKPLRAQLDLESGKGLIVVTVTDESAASNAGIEVHDILMTAGDQQLASQSDLVKAIQMAGKEETEISLTVIRAGNEITVDVTPVERSGIIVGNVGELPQMLHVFPEMNGKDFSFKFKKIEPGVVFPTELSKDFPEEMQKNFAVKMEAMQQRMDEFRKQIDELKKQKNNDDDQDQ